MLFKRKPILAYVDAKITNDDQEVWVIKQTNEIFESYESYMARLDYYMQRKFLCEVTGHSGLTYFEALESEKKASEGVETLFSDALKEPMLRRIQFSTQTRVDYLVDNLFDEFKNDYYPGECLNFARNTKSRYLVVVREKTKFNSVTLPNGETRPSHSKYRIEIIGTYPGKKVDKVQEADQDSLQRDRNSFSKALLRAFIKNVASHGNWPGAPWILKSKYAKRYCIDETVPPELLKPRVVPTDNAEKKPEQKAIKPGMPEDLMLMSDGSSRPPLLIERSVSPELVEHLIQVWTFLNVYCEPLYLDSFTFDDFVDALQFNDPEVAVPLINEIHISLLAALINPKLPKCTIRLPAVSLPTATPVSAENGTKTESNLNTVNNSADGTDDDASSDGSQTNLLLMQNVKDVDQSSDSGDIGEETRKQPKVHQTIQEWQAEFVDRAITTTEVRWQDWRLHLYKRQYSGGGWELALVGLLFELAGDDQQFETCRDILDQLIPEDKYATRKTAHAQYAILSANSKIRILSLLLSIIVQAPLVKEYIDVCLADMTELRKAKTEAQRLRKEGLGLLHDMEVNDKEQFDGAAAAANDKENVKNGKRKAFEHSMANPKSKRAKHAEKLKATIEDYNAQIVKCDDELREANCLRAKLLGQDRFGNRYWWFEAVGMPYKGLPTSSTAFAGFAIARIWVQGVPAEEKDYLLTVHTNPEWHSTLGNRKLLEEGQSVLNGSQDWGYYDSPESLEQLIAWLNPKGLRESKLKGNLLLRKEVMEECMNARKEVG